MTQDFLFLRDSFLKHQGPHVLFGDDELAIALFGQKTWLSPAKAPFGGFRFTKTPDRISLSKMLVELSNEAIIRGVESIEIQLPPFSYLAESSQVFIQVLLEDGYRIQWTDVNFYLVPDRPFRKYLHRSERWKLNKAGRAGFTVEAISHPDWEQIHHFINESRKRKGYSLSMTAIELAESSRQFAGQYSAWRVLSPQGKLAAVAVSIKVCSHIEYIFYTADDPEYRKWSPVVMLHAGIYEDALMRHVEILDLGTASLQGEVNPGVAAFKKFLGGIREKKIRLVKDLVV